MGGPECEMIVPHFNYTKYPDVRVTEWKNTTNKETLLSLWKHIFGMVRCPLHDEDLVAHIPQKGTIVAKYGTWVGLSRSRHAVYITYLFVEKQWRKTGVARRLIHSITHASTQKWGDVPFLFEVEQIPPSLAHAQPVCRYSYIWIPFVGGGLQWKETSLSVLAKKIGFHACTGWVAYHDGLDYIVFDANNDIVWYSSVWALPTFHGEGAYCRIFGWGSGAVFAENMYFNASLSLLF